MKLFTKSEDGFTLLGVLMVLAIFSILGFSILAVTAGSVKLSDSERDDQSVFYIAEAGLAKAKVQMNEEFNEALHAEILPRLAANEQRKPENRLNPKDIFFEIVGKRITTGEFSIGKAGDAISFEKHFGENPFAEVSITKKEENNEVRYEISSVGNIGGKKRVIFQKVDVVFDSDFLPKPDIEEPGPISPLNSCFALYTSGSINADGGSIIEGDIYSSEKLILGPATINGNIHTTEDLEITHTQGIKNIYSNKNVKVNGGLISGSIEAGGLFAISNGKVGGNVAAVDSVTVTGGDVNGSINTNGSFSISNGTIGDNVKAEHSITVTSGKIGGSAISKKNVSIIKHPSIKNDIIAINDIYVKEWFNNIGGDYRYGNIIKFDEDVNAGTKLKPLTKNEITNIMSEKFVEKSSGITNNEHVFNDCMDKIPNLDNKENVFLSKDGVAMAEDRTIIAVDNSNKQVDFIKGGSLKINPTTHKTVLELTSDLYFKEMEFLSNQKLYIDLKGENRTIYVDSLKMSTGHIELVNEGTLNIQVLNDLTVGSGASIKNSDQSDTTNTHIFYAGNNPLMIDGGVNLKSSIHVKDANLTVTSGGGVHGDIYVYGENSVEIHGGSSVVEQLFLAPKSKFNLTGGGVINGNVVAKEFKLSGGARIIPPKENNGSPSPENPSVPEEPEVEIEGKKFSLNFKEQVEK